MSTAVALVNFESRSRQIAGVKLYVAWFSTNEWARLTSYPFSRSFSFSLKFIYKKKAYELFVCNVYELQKEKNAFRWYVHL